MAVDFADEDGEEGVQEVDGLFVDAQKSGGVGGV